MFIATNFPFLKIKGKKRLNVIAQINLTNNSTWTQISKNIDGDSLTV